MWSKGENPFPNKILRFKVTSNIYEVFYKVNGEIKSIYVYFGFMNIELKFKDNNKN